jgi:glycine/D-amino acid oxidase-like deaminating enzyme
MAPKIDPVEAHSTLPTDTDVVVIGGGIVGVSTAYFLAERGIAVALCEKHAIGCEQSSRNWGWCRQMGRDPREIPLIVESLKLWRGMNQRLGEETGFRQCGILYLCETEAEIAKHESWLEHARQYQLDSRMIGGGEASRLVPGATRAWLGALYTPSDGRAEPQKGAPAIARGAARLGAKILTGCAVRGIETSGGRVSAVVTERGTIRCNSVVLAAGAWSRLFCGNLGIELPQLKVVNSVLRTAPLETGLERTCAAGKFAYRKRLDGGYTVAHRHLSVADVVPDSFRLLRDFLPIFRQDWRGLRLRVGKRFIEEAKLPRRWTLDQRSPFESVRVLDPEPVDGILDTALASLKSYFPQFREAEVAERWAGLIDATPDAVPVMAPVDKLPGFYLATGFSGHGFGLGPGAGRLMADLVTGAPPVVDPTPFRYTRFIDGTKLEIVAGL